MKTLFKRMLACLLMAALLLPTAALADTLFDVPSFGDIFTPANGTQANVPTTKWMHESGIMSFDIPADWTVTDKGDLFPMFFEPDGMGNLHLSVTEAGGQNFFDSFSTVKDIFTKQYTAQGVTITAFVLTQFGGRQAIRIDVINQGIQQSQILIQPADYTALLFFTFTDTAIDHVDLVMNSVWLDD